MAKATGVVPRLRFPEFREALAWSERPLGGEGDFLSTLTGKSAQDFGTGQATYVTYMNVFVNTFVDMQALGSVDVGCDESQNAVEVGDVLFTVSSETPEEVGMASVVTEAVSDCYVNSFCAMFRFLEGKQPNLYFLGYSLRQPFVRRQLVHRAQGSTRFNLSKAAFRNLLLAVPTEPEQQKIAGCLTSLDELIAAQARKMEALKTHKRGLMQQLFPRDGETVPRLRFPEFREAREWGIEPLSEFVCNLDAGVSVNSGDRPPAPNEVGVLKTSCVSDGVFDPAASKVVQDDAEIARLKEPVRANTILISRMNTPALVGANAFVGKDVPNLFLPDRLWAAKGTVRACVRFIAYILGSESGRAALSALGSGSSGSMKNIGKTEVLGLQIAAPGLEEQQRIADCLSSLDTRITAETQQLAALKTHKQGLMQQLFPAPGDTAA